MSAVRVAAVESSNSFERDLARAPLPIQRAARAALTLLIGNAQAKSLRLHTLTGLPKPTLWKIDVLPNHSWQITFELAGTTAILKRLATHRTIDRAPR